MKSAATKSTRAYAQTNRAQAAMETGDRVVEAFVERLFSQWFDEITLDRVALDAGVTVQTIVRRFGGKDGLLASAAKSMGQQINARRATPEGGDLSRLIGNLINDYEQTGDCVIRLLALEPRQTALKSLLDFGRGQHRQWVTSAFGESLASLGTAEKQRAIDTLVVATDVYTWKLLRRDMQRSIPATAAAMQSLVSHLLAGVTHKTPYARSLP